jgi:hypothetical protein
MEDVILPELLSDNLSDGPDEPLCMHACMCARQCNINHKPGSEI